VIGVSALQLPFLFDVVLCRK